MRADADEEEKRTNEIGTVIPLLETLPDITGCTVTADALLTQRALASYLLDRGADYLFTVKGNCPETFAALAALDWNAPGVRHYAAPPEKGHGRIETRRIDALTLPQRMLSFDKARQAVRVTRERIHLTRAETTTETAYAITSVGAERADPEQLLAWNRGHWMVENANHYRRDASLGEDASRLRARHAPANNATLNHIALAIVFHRGFHHLPEAHLHFMMQREDALDAILSPT